MSWSDICEVSASTLNLWKKVHLFAHNIIYVYNTKDYKPDFKSDVWDELSGGQHKVKLVVGKTKFMREGLSVTDQGDRYAIKRDDVHKAVYLSDSDFVFVKK